MESFNTEGRRALVFLDASVLVAASRSPSGGSAVTIEVCRGSRFRRVVSEMVLAEARVNIAAKFGDTELVRFYQQLADLDPEIVPPPSTAQLEACVPLTTEKDVHVLAAALACGANYLLTLDRRRLLNAGILAAGLPIHLMTPGDFLQELARQTG